ncbi:MAG: histidine kinase dimerization/phospho-acceptor domain-containing protein [bacterium]
MQGFQKQTESVLARPPDNLEQQRNLRAAELTYLIAHELRNPCAIIGGFAALLNRLVEPADKEGEYARIIVQESARMERAIDAVLGFSQSLGADKSLQNLAEVAAQSVAVLRSRFPRAQVQFSDWRGAEPLYAEVSPEQISGALSEIMGHLLMCSQQEMELVLKIDKEAENGRIYVMPSLSTAEPGELRALVAGIAAPGRDPATLPLTLARESLRLNDCVLELAAESSGKTYLYIEMPLSEGKHAESNHVR